jgi:hypothetical protein
MRAKFTVGDRIQVTKQYKDMRLPLEVYEITNVHFMSDEIGFMYNIIRTKSVDGSDFTKHFRGCLLEKDLLENFTLLPDSLDDSIKYSVKSEDVFTGKDYNLKINTVYIANGVPMIDFNKVKDDVVLSTQHAGYVWFLNFLRDNSFSPPEKIYKKKGV